MKSCLACALAALLSGEIQALSTGFGEAVDLANAGEVKIIGVTSDERVDAYADAPTMVEQGNDTTFVNWRGFFAAPGLPDDKLAMYQDALTKMYETSEWEEVRARNGWVELRLKSGAQGAHREFQRLRVRLMTMCLLKVVRAPPIRQRSIIRATPV